jgi:hypothetical protein
MDHSVVAAMLNILSRFETGTLSALIGLMILSPFGVICLIVFFWVAAEKRRAADEQRYAELLRAYREDTKSILDAYGKDIQELANYYKTNVELVVSWKRIAENFQDMVVLNTQTMQRLADLISASIWPSRPLG